MSDGVSAVCLQQTVINSKTDLGRPACLRRACALFMQGLPGDKPGRYRSGCAPAGARYIGMRAGRRERGCAGGDENHPPAQIMCC